LLERPVEQACFWLAQRKASKVTVQEGAEEETVVVVGGGLTGLWTALFLCELDSSARVVVLEQELVAYGASGRNAGMLSETVDHSHGLAVAHFGAREAAVLARLGESNVAELIEFLHSQRLNCDFEPTGRIVMALTPAQVERCIADAGIGFLFAPAHHPAMKNVGATRVELGTRTIFNLLGPLSNPADVKRQMVGVYAKQWVEPLAQVLKNLGSTRAWIVHGSDGLDEITLTGPTSVAMLDKGAVRVFEIAPEDVGLSRVGADSLKGGDAQTNATALRGVLDGERGAYRDVALLNAAAALIVAERTEDFKEAFAMATKALDKGAARATLDRLVAASNA